jgi:predicted nucleotidyltransferase component of viral defense system
VLKAKYEVRHTEYCQGRIALSELLSFPGEQLPLLRDYPEFDDIPTDRSIALYSLGEIGAEQVITFQDPARNQPRDLYDLWFFTSNAGVGAEHIARAIANKIRFRGREIAGLEARTAA